MATARFQSSTASPAPLAEPLQFSFSGRTAKNRLLKGAMAEGQASWDADRPIASGIPKEDLIEVYRRWGAGGWGVILTGNIHIEYPGSAGDVIITPESPFHGPRFERLQQLATAAKANGSLILGQVNHPGRQAPEQVVKETISASAVQLDPSVGEKWGMKFAATRQATEEDIARVIAGFAHAAQYLERAGFDGMELHAAHGYLLAQFLARSTNKRTDQYGGPLENRMRLIIEVAQEIRRRTSPNFILGIKINSVEFQTDGLTPEEARQICQTLQNELELDFLELSGGTYEQTGFKWTKESTRKREAFFLEFADAIVPALGLAENRKTKVVITGGLRSIGAMVKALDVVDAVGLGRPATQEPALATDILSGKVTGAIKPVQPFDNDSGLGLMASGAQMGQIAHGEQPFNLSDSSSVQNFLADLQTWSALTKADIESKLYGYPSYSGPAEKYDTAY